MSIISISFTLFLIMNSLGLIPLILAELRVKSLKDQRKILIREMLIALAIIFFFNFLGEVFFGWLNISDSTIRMAGGLILFIIAIRMIFPGPKKMETTQVEEPFIVPIAVPLVAGPSLLATIMVFAREEPSIFVMVISILISWAVTTLIFLLSPYLHRLVGDKGLTAFQRLMGLLLTLMAVQMFLHGIAQFVTSTFFPEA